MAHAVMQWVDVPTKVLWWIMPYAAVHCLVELTSSLLPTTQGNNIECFHINNATWFTVWPCGTNSLCTTPLQLKKAVNIVFVFEGCAQGLFEAGEFVPLHAALYLFVCGSYCRCHVLSPAMMEEQNMLSLPAVFKRSAQIQDNPPFALELNCVVQVWHLVLSRQNPQTKLCGRLCCWCSPPLTTFGW